MALTSDQAYRISRLLTLASDAAQLTYNLVNDAIGITADGEIEDELEADDFEMLEGLSDRLEGASEVFTRLSDKLAAIEERTK